MTDSSNTALRAHPAVTATAPGASSGSPSFTRPLTFLLTDIEGSTRLWEGFPEAMRAALARHDDLLRGVIGEHSGVIFKAMGDSFFAVFEDAQAALAAALTAQLGLCRSNSAESATRPAAMPPVRVRMALYSGVVEARDGDYYGPPLNRAARIRDAAHGCQILVAQSTRALLGPDASESFVDGTSLHDLGPHRLRDLSEPERLYQVCHPDLPHDFPPPRTLSGLPNNLPYQITSFVGREAEMSEVRRRLFRAAATERTPDHFAPRLITLTGMGGTGKTRLALQAAAQALVRFEHGTFLAELAALSDPALVPGAVAAAVGVREQPGRPVLDALTEHLTDRSLLLLLDNCEHLIDACAQIADHLLRRCPRLVILATSQEALELPGEAVYPVPPLPVPGQESGGTINEETAAAAEALVSAYLLNPAMRLFVERAQAASPFFELTPDNGVTVAEMCRRLDGLPLAIELAAAWTGALPVEEIATRLDDRFRLLTRGNRAAQPRHRTLRATIDWSYALLSDTERALLRRLSVFAGGCTPEAAEAVCADETLPDFEVSATLPRLAQKSLVVREERGNALPGKVEGESGVRYRLLESIRQYARESLIESGEEEALLERHRRYLITLSDSAEPFMRGPEQERWLDRLAGEQDNYRAALTAAMGTEDALRLASGLFWLWRVRGSAREGYSWLTQVLNTLPSPEEANPFPGLALYARVHNSAGSLALLLETLDKAEQHFHDALRFYRNSGADDRVAAVQGNIGIVALKRRDFGTAQSMLAESLAYHRRIGDEERVAIILGNLVAVAMEQEEYATARLMLEESITLCRQRGDMVGLATKLHNLGDVCLVQGEVLEAYRAFLESAKINQEIKNYRLLVRTAHSLVLLCLNRGDYRQTVQLAAWTKGLAQLGHRPLTPDEEVALTTAVSTAINHLGNEAVHPIMQQDFLESVFELWISSELSIINATHPSSQMIAA